MLKSENGVTLIALIITIIILIILAAITIAAFTDNDMINTAIGAGENYATAQNEEIKMMDETVNKMQKIEYNITTRLDSGSGS